MKKKDLKDLRSKDADDLRKLLGDKRSELMDLRFQHATGALESSARIGQVKRDVARVLTVLNERQPAGTAAE